MIIVHLIRKPLSEGNVAQNVLKWGCGALNIDACRILATSMPKGCRAPGWDAYNKTNAEQGYRPKDYKMGDADYVPSAGGRWPANMILEHKAGCQCVGETQVKTGKVVRHHGVKAGMYGPALKPGSADLGYAGADRNETVASWDCAEGCPVSEMDSLDAGNSCSFRTSRRHQGGVLGYRAGNGLGYADNGGASRFFKQVQADTLPAANLDLILLLDSLLQQLRPPNTKHPETFSQYQEILSLGERAISGLLHYLETSESCSWVPIILLRRISGENPSLPPEDIGEWKKQRDAWVEFLRSA